MFHQPAWTGGINSSILSLFPFVAYHFCLNLPSAFTQPGGPTLADLCTHHLPVPIAPIDPCSGIPVHHVGGGVAAIIGMVGLWFTAKKEKKLF